MGTWTAVGGKQQFVDPDGNVIAEAIYCRILKKWNLYDEHRRFAWLVRDWQTVRQFVEYPVILYA